MHETACCSHHIRSHLSSANKNQKKTPTQTNAHMPTPSRTYLFIWQLIRRTQKERQTTKKELPPGKLQIQQALPHSLISIRTWARVHATHEKYAHTHPALPPVLHTHYRSETNSHKRGQKFEMRYKYLCWRRRFFPLLLFHSARQQIRASHAARQLTTHAPLPTRTHTHTAGISRYCVCDGDGVQNRILRRTHIINSSMCDANERAERAARALAQQHRCLLWLAGGVSCRTKVCTAPITPPKRSQSHTNTNTASEHHHQCRRVLLLCVCVCACVHACVCV